MDGTEDNAWRCIQLKIAVATENEEVAAHFGRCPRYTIADIEDGEICEKEHIDNPGHRPRFLPKYLSEELGIDCMISGGMGQRAQKLFEERDIKTIVGAAGPVDEVLKDFAQGQLETGEDLCSHDGDRCN